MKATKEHAEWMLKTGTILPAYRLRGRSLRLIYTGRWRWTWATDWHPEGVCRRWWFGPWMLKYRHVR